MNKATKLIIALVVVAAVAVGAVTLLGKEDKTNESTSSSTNTSDEQAAASSTITYDENGFSPTEVTVASGSSITIVNQTDEDIEPASGPHPDHTSNSELNFGDIGPGESKTLTVTTKGEFSIHNHYNENKHATITVE